MRKALSIGIALMLCVTLLFGCGGNSEPAETRAPAVQTNVAKPLTQEVLDALPVASADMTVDELRQLCMDFMRYQVRIAWTPSKKFTFYSASTFVGLSAGNIYGGMPYISLASGSLYNFMHFYDERNGMLDIDALEALKQPMAEVIANQCSGSAYWAWSRVSNSLTWEYTYEMFPSRGCIHVGDYYIDPEITNYKEPVVLDTRDMCKENGEQTMFKAYALLQPADGVIYYRGKSGGHTMMISSKPVVVYKADGVTIDGSKSYVTILDQTLARTTSKQENGILMDGFGNEDKKFTFAKLFERGSLPFTIPEFIGQDPVEKANVSASHTADTVKVDELSQMKITSNYPMSYTTITVKNDKGKELFSEHLYTCGLNVYEFTPVDASVTNLDGLRELADGKNTIEITARVGTGEVLTAYSGKLTK